MNATVMEEQNQNHNVLQLSPESRVNREHEVRSSVEVTSVELKRPTVPSNGSTGGSAHLNGFRRSSVVEPAGVCVPTVTAGVLS